MTRIGLTQRVTEVPEYGERRDCLDQAWTDLLLELGYTPVPLPNKIERIDPHLTSLSLDGIVLTSGNDLSTVDEPAHPAPERDRFERELIDWAISMDRPVLGVCRGLELINVHFGGDIEPVEGHVAQAHQVEFVDDHDFEFLPESTMVNSFHDFAIPSNGLAEQLEAIGTAHDGTIECATHPNHSIMAIMWHPERPSPTASVDRQLFRHLFGDAQA